MSTGFKRKKKKDEADLDITPMIDVVFLLLIFFMVTSTMQGTPDRDIPPTVTGDNANAEGFMNIMVLAPKSSGSEGEVKLGEKIVSIDQLKAELIQRATEKAGEGLKVMIYGEREVRSGFMGEVEQVIGEVATDTGSEITMNFAVKDLR